MYDILGKLNSLTPKQQEQKSAQAIYESVDARGSIVAGVKDVEQKLREQFEAMKEGHYDVDDYTGGGQSRAIGVQGTRSASYHGTPGEHSGRPKTLDKSKSKLPADPFGRTTGVIPDSAKVKKKRDPFAEGETVATKTGRVHKGSYGTEYDGDDAPAKPKHVPRTGVKGRKPKDRSADAPFSSNKSHDPFGRTGASAHAGAKGKLVKGKGNDDTSRNKSADDAFAKDDVAETAMNPYAVGMAQAKKEVGLGRAKTHVSKKVEKRGHHIADVIKGQTNESRKQFMTMLSEGINFTEMMKERGRGIDELLAELQADIKSFKETGSVSDFLRDAMEVHGYGKRQLQDAVHPVRGDSFAPQHPATPAPRPSFLDKAKDFGKRAVGATLNTLGHGSDEDLLAKLPGKAPNRYNEDAELNELAKLAGLQVEESIEQVDESMCQMGAMAQEMQQAEQQKGRMSVNTSADSEGNKTVTITADGEEAEKLAQLLTLAGMGSQQPQAHEQAAIVVAQEAKEYGDTEVEDAPEVLNTPRPDVRGMHRSETTGEANTSDDLHKQKSQHPTAAAKGDNPLTKKEKAVEDFNPIESLGAQLMAEYQSIKLQK
jgi:hypothetical protein